MKNHNGEIEALRERISQLSGAILRINSSLDINTVLREVVDSARTLTNARYGIITTLDEEGQILDFISSGFTEEEHQQFVQWRDGPRLFEHFRHLSGAVRLADLPAYVRSLGFSAELIRSKTFQGTPMRHRGVHVGNFFLAEKEGAQEFTGEDEEILVLFASQAGTAITNAWVYHDEQQVRANLEALIETSPIGVVVFDARSGNPVSFNREARRIFEVLRTPGRSIEQLMEVMTYTRADGREITLDEFVLVRELNTGETMRSEEVMFSVADGRSVKALINATPIFSADNVVESVVVAMQDLAPLEELDRMRAEFTSMVSHELRVPLASIKGSASTVLNAQQPLDLTEIHQFFHIIDEQSDHMRSLISDLLDAGRIDMGTLSVNPNSMELADLVDQARNTFLSGGSRHPILIDLPPNLPRVMVDSLRIVQVLVNLFSNASVHSPESSPIRVTAVRDNVYVAVAVCDEGWGRSPKELENLFQKYSHLGGDRAPGISGSLGLVICKGLVEAHGGRIWAESGGAGQGTRITFTIPVTDAPDSGAVSSVPQDKLHPPSKKGEAAKRILVVDDDPQMLRFIRDALAAQHYSPIVTSEHRELSQIMQREKPHLVLLDLVLPGTDGIRLMEHVPELSHVPVIFISAYGRDETIANALERGAADYLVKPFSATELTARIQAALRRQAKPEPFVNGSLVIHYEQRKVTLAGHPVSLTAGEYDLLCILSENVGRVVNYDLLIRQMWSGPDSGDPDRVRTFIKQLRRKLGDQPARPTYILNVRGVGYRMAQQ